MSSSTCPANLNRRPRIVSVTLESLPYTSELVTLRYQGTSSAILSIHKLHKSTQTPGSSLRIARSLPLPFNSTGMCGLQLLVCRRYLSPITYIKQNKKEFPLDGGQNKIADDLFLNIGSLTEF